MNNIFLYIGVRLHVQIKHQCSQINSNDYNFICMFVSTQKIYANSFGVNLYGISHHISNNGFKSSSLNESNIGLGLRASFESVNRNTFFIEGGRFKDSFENQASYLSVGYLVRLFYEFRVGVNAAAYRTNSINRGDAFLAPIPMVSLSVSIITLNAIYLPKYQGVNPYHTIGGYLTINFINGKPTMKK